jgi:hypothetical protein
VALGSNAAYNITSGATNLIAGFESGYTLTTGASNVFLGHEAGYYQTTNSNLLIIDNQSRTVLNHEQMKCLVYGVFDADPANQEFNVNGDLEVRNDSSLGSESLAETDFATHAKWDTVGDFDDTGGNATYTHNGGSGTLTQTSANMAVAGVGNRWYKFVFTCSNSAGSGTAPVITNAFAAAEISLPKSTGTHTVYFKSAAAPGDFVISVTSTSGDTWVIDDLSLKEAQGGNFWVNGTTMMPNIPTADPAVKGQLWSDGGTVKVSAG